MMLCGRHRHGRTKSLEVRNAVAILRKGFAINRDSMPRGRSKDSGRSNRVRCGLEHELALSQAIELGVEAQQGSGTMPINSFNSG